GRHHLRACADVLEPDTGIEEIADALKRLDVLQELAEPGLEGLPGHAALEAGGFPVTDPLTKLTDQMIGPVTHERHRLVVDTECAARPGTSHQHNIDVALPGPNAACNHVRLSVLTCRAALVTVRLPSLQCCRTQPLGYECREAPTCRIWGAWLRHVNAAARPQRLQAHISPNISCLQPCRGRSSLYADHLLLRGHWRAVVR